MSPVARRPHVESEWHVQCRIFDQGKVGDYLRVIEVIFDARNNGPTNDASHYLTNAYGPYTRAFIEWYQPRAIVCMGNCEGHGQL